MKYLKISSFLVLSLLLFAPAALADVECEVRPNSQRVRMESKHEGLTELTIRCTTDADTSLSLQQDGINATDSTFTLELELNGMLSNDDDMNATLMLRDLGADNTENPRTGTADCTRHR